MQKELIFMTKEIDFYFDIISPYSYLAHQKIKNVLSFKSVKDPYLIDENTCNTAKNDW